MKKWIVSLNLIYNVEAGNSLDAVTEAAEQLRQYGGRAKVTNISAWSDEPIPPFINTVPPTVAATDGVMPE